MGLCDGELRGGGKLVGVDDYGVVGAGIVAGVAAVALAGNEFRDAVAVEVDQGEGVGLGEGFVDGVAGPMAGRAGAGLFEPVEAVAVALAVDEVHFAVVVDVVAEDGKAGVAEVPIGVPDPFVVVGIDLLEPAVGGEDVGFAVAVDVGDADAVTVLLLAAEVVGAGFVVAEVDPEDAGAVVVGEREVGLAVAVDVEEGAAFGVEAVGDFLGLPHGAGGCGFRAGVAVPPDAVGDPAGGDEVGQAVVVDVDDPLAAVGDELVVNADGAELVLLPGAAVGAGIFVPVGAAEEVGKTVVVHVEDGDAFSVVGAETMGEEGDAGFAVGAVAGVLQAELGGVGGVLRVEWGGDRGDEQRKQKFEVDVSGHR